MATSERAIVAEQFQDENQQWRADSFGMWLFLGTEAMMFGGLFLAFAIYRSEYAEAFIAGAGHLKLHWGATNTALLILSGLAMGLADPLLERGRRRAAGWCLLAVLVLGAAFLAIKGYEYSLEYEEKLMPLFGLGFDTGAFVNAEGAKLFFGLYFIMTGLHAAHMAVGMGLVAYLAVALNRKGDASRLTRQVRIIGLYWAFVDVVWLLLFPTLYLLGGGGT